MDFSPLDAFLKFLEESPVMQSSKDRIILDLAILKAILIDPPKQFSEDGTLQVLESVAKNAGFIISSFDLEKMNEQMAVQFRMQLDELFVPARDWKCVAQLIYKERPESIRFYYPRIGLLDFIDHLLENLVELEEATASSTLPLNHFISQLNRELRVWTSRLVKISEQLHEPLYVKYHLESITNLVYKLEDVVDSFLIGKFPIWHGMFCLLSIIKEFENVTMAGDVVGFEEETVQIKEMLLQGLMQLQVISITGAPGLGKTTLAKKLYTSSSVVNYFDAHLWCSVTQVYVIKDLLLNLLYELPDLSYTQINKLDVEELVLMVHKCLKGRRFLVVLDDVWSPKAWNDLKRCFPNDNNGSRIVFTTRMQDLAKLVEFNSVEQHLSLLSEDESWELLRRKIFQNESCPLDLLEVGKRIAKHCKGLPLAIVVIAGLLEKGEKTVDQWEQIEKTIGGSHRPEENVQSLLQLIYGGLPIYLQPCLLYFSVFPEDTEISVSKLTRLWIAEGLIKHNEFMSLEEVAENYLNDLIERSLVIVAQEKSNGGVKSCRVHDLILDFCLTHAREENFLLLINGYDELLHSSNSTLDYEPEAKFSSLSSSTPAIYHQRRVCIHSRRNHFIMSKPSGPFVQSLLFFAASDTSRSYSYDISFIFHNFKILRTLDFEGINIGDSLKEIDVLVLLRYLAVKSYAEFIPSSIANLWNLETFIFKGLKSAVEVPNSIWDMKTLRHLHINTRASFDLYPHRLDSSSLDNLQTFSTPILAYGDKMEKILRRLRGIRKLKCIFLDSWDEAKNCNRFPVLEFLNTLETVKVSYNGMGKYPCVFHFPSNLKKLTLSHFRMPWNEISKFARLLCNLEVLKLLSNAVKGETWDVEDECFIKLKFLKLENLDVVTWSANEDHFPRLERLLLHRCKRLVEIPPGFEDILTLEMIEVMWCNTSVANSARIIHEDKLEYGNEGFKINIHPAEADIGESSL